MNSSRKINKINITFKDVISVGLLYLEQFEFKLLSPELENMQLFFY